MMYKKEVIHSVWERVLNNWEIGDLQQLLNALHNEDLKILRGIEKKRINRDLIVKPFYDCYSS